MCGKRWIRPAGNPSEDDLLSAVLGWVPAHDRQHCLATDITCRKCGKRGHYQVVCRSARVSQVDTHTNVSKAFLRAIGDTTNNPWSVTIDVNGTPIEYNNDTGAEISAISEEAWRKVGQPALSPPNCSLRGPDIHKLPHYWAIHGKAIKGRAQCGGDLRGEGASQTFARMSTSYRQDETSIASFVHRPCQTVPYGEVSKLVQRPW